MIAVSQNLMLGNPVAPVGVTAMIDGTTADGGAFLQAFALADVALVVAEDTNSGLNTERPAEAGVVDTPDGDASIEIVVADSAIWQPIAQTIAALPMPSTGLLTEAETGVTPALLCEGDLPSDSKGQPDPIGKTLPQPSQDAASTLNKSVDPQVAEPAATEPAVVFSPDIEVPKPTPVPAAELAGGLPNVDGLTVLEPALSAPPKAIPADSDLRQRRDAIPAAPHQQSAPEPSMPWPAVMPIAPADSPKQPHPVPDVTTNDKGLPAQTSQPIVHISTSESAWRQKWIGDLSAPSGVDNPVDDQRSMSAKTDLVPVTVSFAAPALPLTAAGQKAVMPQTGEMPKTGPRVDIAPALPPPKTVASGTTAVDQVVVTAALDSAIPFADITLDAPGSFDAVSLVAAPAPISQTTIGPLAPLPPTLSPTLLAATSPTIVDMVQTGNDGPLELALSPEELGRLTISIKHDGDFVRVTVIADRPETLDLMRRHGGDLVADLRQAGFSGASLSFGQGGQGGQPRFANAEALTKNQHTPQHLPPETKPTAPNRSRKGSGVDLRF
jgi:hypothetical protein